MSQNDLVTAKLAAPQVVAIQGRAYAYANAQNANAAKPENSRFAQVLRQSQPSSANTVNTASNPAAATTGASAGTDGKEGTEGKEGLQGNWSKTLVSGDTLTGVVKQQAASQGVNLSGSQAHALVMQLAKSNGIANPNRVFAGQKIDLSGLQPSLQAMAAGASKSGIAHWNASEKMTDGPEEPSEVAVVEVTAERLPSTDSYLKTLPSRAEVTSAPSVAQVQPFNSTKSANPVLEKTLDRAVAKGFIPAVEKKDVHQKILELAKRHQFNPDDFAKMTLMESDGMNPRSTNKRCHGIIQFCGGGANGAASAGFGNSPKAILGLSVYQQLHLVDRYFNDVGLKNKGPTGLDDLYLSVLTPNARNESRSDVPLNIPGTQASLLHVGGDPAAPITRQSLLEGLQSHAADLLGLGNSSRSRVQAMRTAAYEDNSTVAQRQDLAAGNSIR